MKKFLVLAAAILLIGNVQAKEVTVTATGMGDSYDWAVMNAVENAVRQSTEVIVHRNAPMEKFEMKGVSSDDYNESENVKVDDGSVIGGKGNIDYKAEGKAGNKMNAVFEEKSIDAHYAGKVDSYKVLSTEEKDGKYIVKIEAIVKKPEDYKSPGLVKKAEYSLSIAAFKSRYPLKCGDGDFSSFEVMEKFNTELTNRIALTKKFSLVSRRDLDDYLDEVALEALNLTKPENRNKLQNLKSADYLLVGSIDYFNIKKTTTDVEMTGESYSKTNGRVQVSYRLIETGTMEVVAAGAVEAKFKKDGGKGKCEMIAGRLMAEAADKIVDQLMMQIFPDYKPVFEPARKEADAEKKAKAAKKAAPKKRQVVKLPFDK